jgi:hypothetical protein
MARQHEEGEQMAKAWWIFNEDDERVTGPFQTKDVADFDLRVARQYDEAGPDAYVAKDHVSEDDWR